MSEDGKMTQQETLLWLFKQNGNRVTLGFLLQHNVGYRAVQRFYDMRKKGFDIQLVKQDHEHPSNNVYELKSGPGVLKFEENGQEVFA